MRAFAALLATLAFPLLAAEPRPEIQRETGKPQADGTVHTVRGIPEACARLEGLFTGSAAQPYRLTAVKSHPNCQPRARFVDFSQAQPSQTRGWRFNDLIRIPSAACPSLKAIVRVWRRPGEAVPPKLDAQGRARIYLKDAMTQEKMPAPTLYAAEMTLEGKVCGS